MADLTDHDERETQQSVSLLDHLGALREQRANETTTDVQLPGFEGRLWATVRLPDAGKATQVATLMAAGNSGLLSAAQALLAKVTIGLYTGPDDPDAKVRDDDGHLTPGFSHLPDGSDDLPVNFTHPALERVGDGKLCPPRAGGKEHTPETRARALFGRDALLVQAAMQVCGWAIGGGDGGALAEFSERFVGE